MQHYPTDVGVPVAGKRPAPRLDCIDCFDPSGEPKVLSRLHDGTGILIEPDGIFIKADNVRRILRELNIARRSDSHCFLGVGGQGKECFCMSLCPIWVRVMIFESHEIQTTGLRTVIRDYFDSRKKRDFCENVV